LSESTMNMKVESMLPVRERVGMSVTKSVKVIDIATKKKNENSLM